MTRPIDKYAVHGGYFYEHLSETEKNIEIKRKYLYTAAFFAEIDCAEIMEHFIELDIFNKPQTLRGESLLLLALENEISNRQLETYALAVCNATRTSKLQERFDNLYQDPIEVENINIILFLLRKIYLKKIHEIINPQAENAEEKLKLQLLVILDGVEGRNDRDETAVALAKCDAVIDTAKEELKNIINSIEALRVSYPINDEMTVGLITNLEQLIEIISKTGQSNIKHTPNISFNKDEQDERKNRIKRPVDKNILNTAGSGKKLESENYTRNYKIETSYISFNLLKQEMLNYFCIRAVRLYESEENFSDVLNVPIEEVNFSRESERAVKVGLTEVPLLTREYLLAKIALCRNILNNAITKHERLMKKLAEIDVCSGRNRKVELHLKFYEYFFTEKYSSWRLKFENYFSRQAYYLRRWPHGFIAVFSVLMALLVLWDPLLGISGKLNLPANLLSSVLGINLFIILFSFLIISLNINSLSERIEQKLIEDLHEEVEKLSATLTQANLNAAALNIRIDDRVLPFGISFCETAMRKLDEKMRVKEAVSSFEKVVIARQRDVSEHVKAVKLNQQRARNAVKSAAGGVFVGFFTYQVGDSVLRYIRMTRGTDDQSFSYWLESVIQHQSAPETSTSVVSQPTLLHLNSIFEQQYLQPSMFGEAWLLTVTLLVTAMAAWMGWRKPIVEAAGGNEVYG